MGSGPSSSSSNSSSEIRLSENPDIRNFGTIVKISIYGNGLVHGGFWFGTHHVFSVLQTEKGIFTLLEVAKCSNGKINIHMGTAKSLSEVIKTRLNTQDKETFWRSDNVKISPLLVQQVIDEYHGNVYHPTVRSCRTFVDNICSVYCVEINQEQSESEITDVFVIDQEQSIYNNYRICSGIDEEESI
ncbi:unnamed protein product [Rotaria socialis]|uniref:Uncharacterized protein n=2 Tax=Rotaria socialis TaxID=392032 RepID=A0A818BKD5_9BILA|nr:unnamed protein product [Rotaria socialis]